MMTSSSPGKGSGNNEGRELTSVLAYSYAASSVGGAEDSP
jgi:hypothetical protein